MNTLKRFAARNANVLVTVAVFAVMFLVASIIYPSFFSLQNFLNLFIDNAHLGIIAIGMTLVIASGSGGIDLSVGSVMGLSTMIISSMVEVHHMSPFVVIPFVLLVGMTLGFGMGSMIHWFKVPPFIATLVGMYFARGLCYLISLDQIQINGGFFYNVSQTRLYLTPTAAISVNVIIYLVVIVGAFFFTRYTRTGRVIYAMGGNVQSAQLMGLPVKRSKLLVYTISGFCSALGGVVFTFYMLSGYALHGNGLEMDAIASAVIGGTLLTGGVGPVIGTVFGTLILGIIQTIISFQGTLSSWWTKIIIAALILISILLQNIMSRLRKGKTGAQGVRKKSAAA